MSVRPSMSSDFHLPLADEPVLSTLNPDGTRRWLSPRLAPGALWRRRRAIGWILIVVFAALPWIRIGGQPPILLDVVSRRFTFFGTVFRPTDTLLLALLVLAIFTAIFLLTALVGRAWCGWACPQTVYMEFVYRPLERFFMAGAWGKRNARVPAWRLLAMYGAFVLVSAHLANTFLAYFVGTDRLVSWTLGSPSEHPTAFAVFTVTTGLMLFDFAFFREQLCTLVCPYGRMQSVLLDRDSLIVGYDSKRGEPRGRRRATAGAGTGAGVDDASRSLGDCVDCSLCVQVCPTGIDIRKGLQMECINCTQCIDACNAVMEKIGRPSGLIRCSSQSRLEGTMRRGLRPRLILYPALLVGFVASLVVLLSGRADAAVVQKRTPGVNFAVAEDGSVSSPLKLRVDNRTGETRSFLVSSADPVVVLEGRTTIEVPPNDSGEFDLLVHSPRASFERGRRTVPLRVIDDRDRAYDAEAVVLGPLEPPPIGGAR